MSEWQDIASVPKGGRVDLFFPYPRGRTVDCFWSERDQMWEWRTPRWEAGKLLPEDQWDTHCYPNMQPTHWMPLPSPPAPQKQGRG